MGKKLTPEEIDALVMWINKQHGIMPNQYHHTYEQGDTLIYPEHIQDLLVIDKMMQNKMKMDREKAEAQQKHKEKNPLGMKPGAAGFYGHKQRFK